MEEVGERGVSEENFLLLCLKMPDSWLLPWVTVGSGRWPGTAWSQHVDLPLSSLLRNGGQVAYWDTLGCGSMGRIGGGEAVPSLSCGVGALSSWCLLSFYFLI